MNKPWPAHPSYIKKALPPDSNQRQKAKSELGSIFDYTSVIVSLLGYGHVFARSEERK